MFFDPRSVPAGAGHHRLLYFRPDRSNMSKNKSVL
jgi:hypothetical protein